MKIRKKDREYLIKHQLMDKFDKEFDQKYHTLYGDGDPIRISTGFAWGRSHYGLHFWDRIDTEISDY